MRENRSSIRVSVFVAGLLALALALAGCARVGGSSSPTQGPDPDNVRLHAEADADLSRWASAVAAGQGSAGFVPVAELTGQIGDWEESNGDFKVSLMSGVVQAATNLPADPPPAGQIRWPDGSSTTVPLLAAAQALDAIRENAAQPCPDCRALMVTAARLTTQPFETNRGSATVPTWAFTVQGTAVEITRVAVATTIGPVAPTWNPDDPPIGIWIENASIAADDRTLTAHFVGAPGPATVSCGDDYTAEAVESDLAVVVIVHRYTYQGPSGNTMCDLVGADRTATVLLAMPLGDRAVLEVREGRAVRVTGPS
ncbi:MAG TPA: hypothetical protein VE011_01135 [Candidatus Dormibacteraeota bacterium]|nr:hypothetical protein [Candidatus Dormibacteraeota bacterium]